MLSIINMIVYTNYTQGKYMFRCITDTTRMLDHQDGNDNYQL